MNKAFNQYSDQELLTLTTEQVSDAICLEAINREVQPPIPLSEALKQSEWVGFKKPVSPLVVYELVASDKYNSPTSTGVAYLDEAKALAAMEGIVVYDENRYSKAGPTIRETTVTINKRFVGYTDTSDKAAKFEAFQQDTKAFDEIKDECIERLSAVRQAAYNKRVNEEKKAEYLRLANNNETIAKSFWARVEKTEWPE